MQVPHKAAAIQCLRQASRYGAGYMCYSKCGLQGRESSNHDSVADVSQCHPDYIWLSVLHEYCLQENAQEGRTATARPKGVVAVMQQERDAKKAAEKAAKHSANNRPMLKMEAVRPG